MADKRRRSPEGSGNRRKDYERTEHNELPRMRSGAEYLSSSSSSSSSYIDISRRFPNRSGLRTFFTAPSERRRLRKRKSTRSLKSNSSSSSSINSDLAYGTGFIKRPKGRGVRSRKGKDIDRERQRNNYRERETISREKDRSGLSRATTDAEILAVGAGLAKLARDQNKLDLKAAKSGYRSGLVKESSAGHEVGWTSSSRGLGPSKISHGSDTFDEDGWESASDAGSESSVDSKLAFGGDSKGGWFGWGGSRYRPQSRKSSVVDPALFGPANSLNGIVTQPVGFGDVSWSSSSDFGQQGWTTPGPIQSAASGSQSSLQHVYPIPTSDPSRFEAARSSVVSGAEPYMSSRPAPIPLQQPQPIAPVSQSVYEPSYPIRGEPKIMKSSSGRSKSLAEAALVGVAGAAVGAAIASERKEKRRDDRDARDDDHSFRRDERRRERHDSIERDDRKERRREKEKSKDSADDSRREKKREKRRDEGRDDGKDSRREKRREERRSERSDDRYEPRRSKSEASVSTTSVDPFQFQVSDDAFDTPIAATPVLDRRRIASGPTVVTVEREPDFTRKRSSSIKDQADTYKSDHRKDVSEWDDRESRYRTNDSRDRSLREAQHIYDESKHSTAPIEIAAIEAAVGAVTAEDYRESRSDRRREERRGERREHERDDYDHDVSSRNKESARESKSAPERDPIQEEADRAYREIVMARKIASQVIRSRSPSPDRSVVDKYEKEVEEEVIRIVTPPGMEDHKKEGPYDAPNADFKLDLIIEHPREMRNFSAPSIDQDGFSQGAPNLKRDPDALGPRPVLNLVRPTPTPSPMPEKQAARAESSKPANADSQKTPASTSDVVIDNKGNVVSSPISKGVTWGENETKHYEVESPQEHKDEFVSASEIQSREKPVDRQVETSAKNPVEKSKSSNGSKRGGWGVIVAGITGASVGAAAAAANSNDTSETSKVKENEKLQDAKQHEDSYEYRGVIVEPESPPRRKGTRSPPSTGPKPPTVQSSRVPGAFDDDLDFTATVAAGLQDTGFDPNIVINDPSFRRRDSPPGSNQPGIYQAPFAETVSDLGSIPGSTSESKDAPRGFVMGEVPETPKDWRSVSPDNDEFTTKLSKKEQKKREKAARRQSGDAVFEDQEPISTKPDAEPDSYFETIKLSKKEQKKRDKAAQKQGSKIEEVTPFAEPSVAEEIVEEPESYFETPKKSKKSKRNSSAFDEGTYDSARDDRKVSVPVDAFDDLRNEKDDWSSTKKSKKKSKRDSERFDSPSQSAPSEVASDMERSSSKKSKDKSQRKSEHYEFEADPREVSLPPSTPSENSRDGDEEFRKSRKSSKKDSTDREDSRSVVSADTSRYVDDYRKSKKKSRSSTRDDTDDTRSVASAPVGDDYDDAKKTKKKDKKSGGSFFGLFGSKSDSGQKEDNPKETKDDFEDSKKKTKQSKRNSVPDGLGLYGDISSRSISDLAHSSSNGNGQTNGSQHYEEDANGGPLSDDDKKFSRSRAESTSSKKDSFLAKAGTLGAGVGIAGAVVAIAAQHHQQSKADQIARTESSGPTLSGGFGADEQQYHEIFDPEITQRQFRPSIDPQYGDLLPLPPSDPPSPTVEFSEDLPSLPDSRPDTPEGDRLLREKATSSVRRSLQETPVKSPSQSAVPLKFIMGNRSIPSSPGLARSSPLQSPATPREDSLAFPRTNRPRPTSWDSSKEFKPLYLVESNRRGSNSQSREPEETLPSLPPSQPTSRSSSQLHDIDAIGHGDTEQSHIDKQAKVAEPLSINTAADSAESGHGFLDSQQSTPKADVGSRDFESSVPLPEDNSSLPDVPRNRPLSPGLEIQEQSHEYRGQESKPLADAALVSSIGYFASSPRHRTTKESWLKELPSRLPIQRQPSPVDPVTKDRSSYLLQSSPLPGKVEDDDQVQQEPDSPLVHRISAFSDGETLHNIQEREGIDIFGQIPQSKFPVDQRIMEPPLAEDSDDAPAAQERNKLALALEHDNEVLTKNNIDSDFPNIDEGAVPTQEEFFVKSKKDSKKGKKKNKDLSRSSTQDDLSLPDPTQEIMQRALPAEENMPTEKYSMTRKDKKKDRKKSKATMPWELEEDAMSQPLREAPLTTIDDIQAEATAADDFSIIETKKSKKKDKKKNKSALGVELDEHDSKTSEAVDLPAASQDITFEEPIPKEPQSTLSHAKEDIAYEVLQGLPSEVGLERPSGHHNPDSEIPTPSLETEAIPQEPRKPSLGTAYEASQVTHEPFSAPGRNNKAENTSPREDIIDHVSTSVSGDNTIKIPTAEMLSYENKKGKKKTKTKPRFSWETKQEEDAVTEPLTPLNVSVDDFNSASSKKVKRSKNSQHSTPVGEPSVEKSEELPKVTEMSDISEEKPRAIHGKTNIDVEPEPPFSQPLKEMNRKLTLAQAWETELEKGQTQVSDQISDSYKTVVAAENQKVELEKYSPLSPDGETRDVQPPSDPVRSAMENTQVDSAGEAPQTEAVASKEDNPAPQATPMGGPGAWPVTPVTPWTSTNVETSSSLSGGYFPSAASLHSPQSRNNKNESGTRGYFPSAAGLLPLAIVGASVLKDDHLPKDSGALKSIPTQVSSSEPREMTESHQFVGGTQPDAFTQDGLKAGYDHDQLALAKKLQEEFGAGRIKSKKDKKNRRSLPSTPDSDAPRFREVEAARDDHPRARSVSIGRSPIHEDVDNAPTGENRQNIYREDQLALARQLKAEFESGDKKSKKDKKKRSGIISRSTTQDSGISNTPSDAPEHNALEVAPRFQDADLGEVDLKVDGLALGYQEDQLSLARQLQAEFGQGSKKSKKDKRRRSASQTPVRESKPSDDYFGQRSQSVDHDLPQIQNVTDNSNPGLVIEEPVRDGLAVGYSEDQLELARQLKDEFGSGSKKSKKDKKRQGLSRSTTSDFSATDQIPGDIDEGVIPDIGGGIPNEGVLPESLDEYAIVRKKGKKDKKGRKRDSGAKINDGENLPQNTPMKDKEAGLSSSNASNIENLETGMDNPLAPDAEDELTFTNEQSQDKKSDSFLRNAPDEISPSDDFGKAGEALHNSREVDAANVETERNIGLFDQDESLPQSRKQSKKEKKRRKNPQATSSEETGKGLEEDFAGGDVGGQIQEEAENSEPLSLDSTPHESTLKPDLIGKQSEETPTNPPKDLFGEYVFTEKKSKKGKKKRKGSLTAEAEEQSGASTPLEPIPEVFDSTSSAPIKGNLEDNIAAGATSTIPSDNPEDSSVKEVTEEPDDEWGTFATKKSKKDKKQRKSGPSTPVEGSSSFLEPKNIPHEYTAQASGDPRNTDARMADIPSQEPEELQDPAAEQLRFIVKKSKKDKKKRESGLSTPVEQSSSFTEPEGALEIDSKSLDIQAGERYSQGTEQQDDVMAQPQPDLLKEMTKTEGEKQKSSVSTPLEEIFSLKASKDKDGLKTTAEPHAINIVQNRSDDHEKQDSSRTPIIDIEGGTVTSSNPSITTGHANIEPEDDQPSTSGRPFIMSTPRDDELPLEEPEPTTFLDPNPTAQQMTPAKSGDVLSSGVPVRKLSKKDKRKRQATADTSVTDEAISTDTPQTSWADEVEEAEVERSVPVIEDITKSESLSHIPSAVEPNVSDDFIRPNKKGKKGKKRYSGLVESTSKDDTFRPPIGDDATNVEPKEKNFNPQVLAAASALTGAALVAGTSGNPPSVPEDTRDALPARKLSKKEKRKKSVDRRSSTQDDIFDDPALWEGEKPRAFEEPADSGDDAGGEAFGSAIHDDNGISLDNQNPPVETTVLTPEPLTHQQLLDTNSPSTLPPMIEHELALEERGAIQDFVEPDQPGRSQRQEKPNIQSRDLQKPEGQWNDLPDEFIGVSLKKDKKKKNRSHLAAWETPRPQDEPSIEVSTTNLPSTSKLPRTVVEEPQSDHVIYPEVTVSASQEAILVPTTVIASSNYHNKDVNLEDSDPIKREPFTHIATGTYSHPGSSNLPVVREESPIPMDFEHTQRHSQAHTPDDTNRDSAFVTESPIPRQKGFADNNEHIRDSGVHLRDMSPAPISATDEAIARMSWPAVDEETETVDLHKPQRSTIEPDSEHYEDRAVTDVRSSKRKQGKTRDTDETPRSGNEPIQLHYNADGGHRSVDTRNYMADDHQAERHRNQDLHQSIRDNKSPPTHHDNYPGDHHHDQSPAGHGEEYIGSRDLLPSMRNQMEKPTELHRTQTIHRVQSSKGIGSVKQRVERIESPDSLRSHRPKQDKYAELNTSQRPKADKPPSLNDNTTGVGAALAGATMGFAAARQASREQRPGSVGSNRSASNINRLRTPDPKHVQRPDSVGSNRSSATPPLRRSDRKSGDLRSLSQQSKPDLAKEAELAAIAITASNLNTANPTANEGRVRAKDMADVYDGFGEGRMGSPRSPTRPHSMRRRQSMQVLDLEQRLTQLADENRMLAEAKSQAERALQTTQHSSAALAERDAEIDSLKRTLEWLQNEVTRLTEVNDGLTSANITLGNQHNDRYGVLESQHAQTTRELQEMRDSHDNLSAGMEGIVKNEVQNAVQDKDREIAQLRAELDAAKEQIREMQRQILASKANDSEFLTVRDEDYFDTACQQLCQHVQQWVLRFSKFSDMRACRLTSEINNDKIIDRLDNAILDGSDVDSYLADRVKRRDVFMSMTMTMVWEFVFTRYLFGMDREQRQKLKSLEKLLSEVGPAAAVHQWRATTLTLLSKREAFVQQREQDTLAVVNAVLETLTEILPPPSHLEDQIQEQLVRVMKAAVDLSIEMRTQRAEYMMLPPLQPEYDANGDLASKVSFNAALMNERSGDTVSNEELEEAGAVVRIVLFPLVVKKGDDSGEGDEEIVVCPAQVLVAKPKKTVRVFTPESMAHQNHSRISMQSGMPQDYGDNSVI